ncbi:MAG TPA: hypothetical protein VMT22_18270 [Terriglobales bacterium]|jgi:hypothetical protein|nr:hypothetical protein [Terriglobales bacterium]
MGYRATLSAIPGVRGKGAAGFLIELVAATKPQIVVPAFCEHEQLAALAKALAPARVTFETPIAL